jgi:hypothetical protein
VGDTLGPPLADVGLADLPTHRREFAGRSGDPFEFGQAGLEGREFGDGLRFIHHDLPRPL